MVSFIVATVLVGPLDIVQFQLDSCRIRSVLSHLSLLIFEIQQVLGHSSSNLLTILTPDGDVMFILVNKKNRDDVLCGEEGRRREQKGLVWKTGQVFWAE